MKNRKSLNQKLDYCVQHGTLQTLSEGEALSYIMGLYPTLNEYRKAEMDNLTKAYKNGKVLCRFEFFDEDEFSTLHQLNTPSKFITEIIYPILTNIT